MEYVMLPDGDDERSLRLCEEMFKTNLAIERKVAEGLEHFTMKGAHETMHKITDLLVPISKELWDLGCVFCEAPYHGWYGEALVEEEKIREAVEKAYMEFMLCVMAAGHMRFGIERDEKRNG